MAITGDQIRAARERKGWSQARLAAEVGISQPAIKKIEAGTTVRSKFLPDIESKLGLAKVVESGNDIYDFRAKTKPSELQKWVDSSRSRVLQTRRTAVVRGRTAAGVWMEVDSFDQEKYDYPIPRVQERYEDLEQFSYCVAGNSMDNLRIFDGDFVICVEYAIARGAPQAGDVVIAERRRGGLFERTCKRIEIVDNALALTSHSSDASLARNPIPLSSSEDDVTIEIVGLVIGAYRPMF